MSFTGLELATELGEMLNDPSFGTWDKTTFIFPKITEAQLLIAHLRPDSCNTRVAHTLAATLHQSLPTDSIRLLDITRNLGVGGAVLGKPIKRIDRKVINETIPEWTTETHATRIQHFIYDEENPRMFFVYPTPTVDTLQVELFHVPTPTVIDGDADELTIADTYVSSLLEWVMYRCLANPTAGANFQQAITHRNNFFTILGVKRQSDEIISQLQRKG